jgi:hypothetical protein
MRFRGDKMTEAAKKLLDRFYQEFAIISIIFVFTVLITIVLTIFYLVKCRKMTIESKIGTLTIYMLLLILSFSFATLFSKYYNDYIYLKTNLPIEVNGKVIGYSNEISGDELTTTKSWPIILVEETNEELSLNVIKSEEKLQINEVYTFLYLPNTKISEMVDNQKQS